MRNQSEATTILGDAGIASAPLAGGAGPWESGLSQRPPGRLRGQVRRAVTGRSPTAACTGVGTSVSRSCKRDADWSW